MALYGYARVSTTDQDLSIQIDALRRAGCGVIKSERVSGTSRQGREALALLLEFIDQGDTLVVTRIDRLARSMGDLQDIVRTLQSRGAHLRATEQQIDTSTAAGRAFLNMLGVFAEFETSLRQERQAEGIAKARQEGKYKGRPRTISDEAVQSALETMTPTQAARHLGVSLASIYRKRPSEQQKTPA